jgi:hypothetical protein
MKTFQQYTKGLVKAISKPMRVKKECGKCGTIVPVYKGKYPNMCPYCKELLNINKTRQVPKLEKENEDEFIQPEKGNGNGKK